MRKYLMAMIAGWSLLGFATSAQAFGVDVCFNDPAQTSELIRNCIGVEEDCRQQPLGVRRGAQCRILALADSLGGLSGSNAIIGGRSMVHSDAVYLMAQLNGFSAWQAYQIMIYGEATDQSAYEPFDQRGRRLMSVEEMEACYASDMQSSRRCLAITPLLTGVYKFNDTTGGQLLHLHARYAPSPAAPVPADYPTDYLAPANQSAEPLVNNLHAWAFGERNDACVSGITQGMAADGECLADKHLEFPMNFFAFGYEPAKIPFRAETGTLLLNESPRVTSRPEDMQAYLPHDPEMAKMGVYLHALTDRGSHHMCTDRSYFYQDAAGNFTSVYSSVACAQGSHFLWHVWEQGTNQARIANEDYRTIEPALMDTWRMLAARAATLGLTPRPRINQQKVVRDLVRAIGLYDPQRRLNRINALIEGYGLTPLPGHGRYRGKSLETWLQDVGAVFQ